MDIFSPAQLVGYLALATGLAAFAQKNDRRLKQFNAVQCTCYAIHFALLGNPPASASMALSGLRSVVALKTRSPWVAGLMLLLIVALGGWFAQGFMGWLPVVSCCVATAAIFLTKGIPLRLALLSCTLMWIAVNIASGSIGGTILEVTVATTNVTTMLRLWKRPRPQEPLA